jgi:hypothetical protein
MAAALRGAAGLQGAGGRGCCPCTSGRAPAPRPALQQHARRRTPVQLAAAQPVDGLLASRDAPRGAVAPLEGLHPGGLPAMAPLEAALEPPGARGGAVGALANARARRERRRRRTAAARARARPPAARRRPPVPPAAPITRMADATPPPPPNPPAP